ncbi:hypothetical protein AB5N19_12951 [Seiridium cardinale]|uniref:Uncharacterized protein n=1 Tax=Seiridium cardinale TaxID=138064 RepID=A0ABR2XRC1_9PEZI
MQEEADTAEWQLVSTGEKSEAQADLMLLYECTTWVLSAAFRLLIPSHPIPCPSHRSIGNVGKKQQQDNLQEPARPALQAVLAVACRMSREGRFFETSTIQLG